MVRCHLLRVNSPVFVPRRVLMSAESSGRCSNTIRFSRSHIPNASNGGTCASVSSVSSAAPSPATAVAVVAAVPELLLLLLGGGGKENALQGCVRRKFVWAHKYTCEIARDPLGVGGVIVAACDGAEDDERCEVAAFILDFCSFRNFTS
jgi:hypothetical protein